MSDPLDPVKWHLIQDVQLEITRWADEQFPGRTEHNAIYKLMVHEIPEMMSHRKEKGTAGIGTELADCFILLMDLASMWGVDLSEAIRAKMEINYRRVWERDAHGIYQHALMPPARPDEPRRIQGCGCPNCGKVHNIFSAPIFSKWSYVCYDCGHEFDDNIPF